MPLAEGFFSFCACSAGTVCGFLENRARPAGPQLLGGHIGNMISAYLTIRHFGDFYANIALESTCSLTESNDKPGDLHEARELIALEMPKILIVPLVFRPADRKGNLLSTYPRPILCSSASIFFIEVLRMFLN